ncbi:MAG: N-acyl-D-amino-acid deacylase family protein [Actinomycetota bacterium]
MYDLVLRGGLVHDGLGGEPFEADVAIEAERIVAVAPDAGPAKRVVDVSGRAVAPGFIDTHAHSDMVPLMSEPQPFKLLQGVTTEIVGNCGFSFAPLTEDSAALARETFSDLSGGAAIEAGSFGDFLDRLEDAGPTNNVAALVGHNTVRMTANGMDRALREGALEAMERMVDESIAAGAIGFSTGLIYVPGTYSDADEVVALARAAHRWGGLYATHMRSEDRALGAALDEAIAVGRRAQVRVQISHCKAAGRSQHGDSTLLLEKLHAARADGVDLRGDQYPYLAGATFLSALIPPAAHEGGPERMRERLRDPGERARVRAAAEDQAPDTGTGLWRETLPGDVLVVHHRDAGVEGKTLEELAAGRDAWDVMCELVERDPTAMMVVTLMDEDDVRAIMADPLIGIGSDNGIPVGLEHPRTWGCFPRLLGRYVRELGVLARPEAIRKMTSLSASHFGLTGRGWIGAGAIADVTVFDPETIGHDGTYQRPNVDPTGVDHVVLGGRVVVDEGAFTGDRAGRVIRRSG